MLKYFHLPKTQSQSQWTNEQLYGVTGVASYNGRPVVLADRVLDAFRDYVNSLTLPFSFDNAIGFLK
jgi:hypothetical protein